MKISMLGISSGCIVDPVLGSPWDTDIRPVSIH